MKNHCIKCNKVYETPDKPNTWWIKILIGCDSCDDTYWRWLKDKIANEWKKWKKRIEILKHND